MEYRFEDVFVRVVRHAVLERDVHRVVRSFFLPHVGDVARAGEVVPVLVEGHRHYAVRQVERFFHAVAVMNVDVHVHYARKHSA